VVVGEGGQANDQVRDHGGQGAKYWPPFVPWVQRGAGLGWVWSGGSTLVALGRCGVRWPVTPTGTGGGGVAPLPPRHRTGTGGWGPGLGPRVFLAQRPFPQQLQVQDLVMGRRAGGPLFALALRIHPDRKRPPSQPCPFPQSAVRSLTRSCADSDWRSSANQGRGSRIALSAHWLH
jgi:hypothetical protein